MKCKTQLRVGDRKSRTDYSRDKSGSVEWDSSWRVEWGNTADESAREVVTTEL